jgi:hypothetical protein
MGSESHEELLPMFKQTANNCPDAKVFYVDNCCSMRSFLVGLWPKILVKLDIAHMFFRITDLCLGGHKMFRGFCTSLKETVFGCPGHPRPPIECKGNEIGQRIMQTVQEWKDAEPDLISDAAIAKAHFQIKKHVNHEGEGIFGKDCISHYGLELHVPTVDGASKSSLGSSLVENIWTHLRKVIAVCTKLIDVFWLYFWSPFWIHPDDTILC